MKFFPLNIKEVKQPNILETWNNEKFYWIYSLTSDKHDIRAAARATEASPPFPYLLLTLTNTCRGTQNNTSVTIIPAAWTQWKVDVSKNSFPCAATLRSFRAWTMHAVFILFNFNQNTSCIFNLYTNRGRYLGWKNIAFIQFLFFFYTCSKCNTANQCWGYHRQSESCF